MCVIWGIPYLLIKVSLDGLGPVDLVFVRLVIGALVLVPIALTRVEVGPILRKWRWVVAYTIVEIGVPWVLVDRQGRAGARLSSGQTSTGSADAAGTPGPTRPMVIRPSLASTSTVSPSV